MSKLLLVIDVQNSFINDNTKEVLPKIEEIVKKKEFEHIAFTRFINDVESCWYKKLGYTGCISEEEQKIVISTYNYRIFEKKIYSALNRELREFVKENNINQIYLSGFDTDACIQKTALDLFENDYDVYVLKDYCMCSKGVELHNVIINNLKRLIGTDKII